MDEYIKREEAIEAVNHALAKGLEPSQYLEIIPTEDVAPVRRGRWIRYHEADIGYDEYGVRCSNCNFEVEDQEVDFVMNYCPNCGEKMDGGAD